MPELKWHAVSCPAAAPPVYRSSTKTWESAACRCGYDLQLQKRLPERS